jgi:hypothetical protein
MPSSKQSSLIELDEIGPVSNRFRTDRLTAKKNISTCLT